MVNNFGPEKGSLMHALERCGTAVRSAIVSEADLPTRLQNAFDRHMSHLRPPEFPQEIWERVERLRAQVHSDTVGSGDNAARCLKEMLDIYEDVAKSYFSRFPEAL